MNTGWDPKSNSRANTAIAAHLRQIAATKTVVFKRDAYLRAADIVVELDELGVTVADMTAEQLRALRGIGPSTSGAIVAFCAELGERTPAPATLEHDFRHGGIFCQRCRCRRSLAPARECRELRSITSLAELEQVLGAKIESAQKPRRSRRAPSTYGQAQQMALNVAMTAGQGGR